MAPAQDWHLILGAVVLAVLLVLGVCAGAEIARRPTLRERHGIDGFFAGKRRPR